MPGATQLNFGAPLAFRIGCPCRVAQSVLGSLRRRDAPARRRFGPSAAGWYPEQALTLPEAFSAYTHGAAYAANAEHRLGKLAENYLADLIAGCGPV
jgi:cytosine/adenosine deaminase-related metal-dependent hydrolase